jgi:hypothetical protein
LVVNSDKVDDHADGDNSHDNEYGDQHDANYHVQLPSLLAIGDLRLVITIRTCLVNLRLELFHAPGLRRWHQAEIT